MGPIGKVRMQMITIAVPMAAVPIDDYQQPNQQPVSRPRIKKSIWIAQPPQMLRLRIWSPTQYISLCQSSPRTAFGCSPERT